jgi:WD40 repeat protein
VALSPDGKYVAACGLKPSKGEELASQGWLSVWETATGKLVTTLERPVPGSFCVAFSADSKTLAAGSDDKIVRLWDVTSGRRRATLHVGGLAFCLAFSSDGKLLAVSSVVPDVRDGAGAKRRMALWDVATGKERTVLDAQTAWPGGAVFSPDGKTLACVNDEEGDGSGQAPRRAAIDLWDVATGQRRTRLTRHGSAVWSLAFSPDGKVLASASADGTLLLWDPGSPSKEPALLSAAMLTRFVTFLPDGKTLASAGGFGGVDTGGVVQLWDVAARTEVATLPGYPFSVEHPSFLAASRDGKLLAFGGADGVVRLFDVKIPATPGR